MESGLRWSGGSTEDRDGVRGWAEEDIYLPVLKATSTECEKVWDAEIIVCDNNSDGRGKVRLARVR